jgi:hypothetical protein
MLGTLAVGLALIVGVVVWRLSAGPVSLGFLNRYIEQALGDPAARIRLKVDDTVLAWPGWPRPLDLRVVGVRVLDADNLIMTLPDVSISLSARALLDGIVAPVALTVPDAQIHLHRAANGQFDLSLGGQATAQGGPNILLLVMHHLTERPDPARPISYLNRVSITGAAVTVEDSLWDKTWQAHLDLLTLERDSLGVRQHAVLDLHVGGAVSTFEVSGLYNSATRSTNLSVKFDKLEPAVFARASSALAPLSHFAVPLDGVVAANLNPDGALDDVRFDVRAGAGHLSLPELYPEDMPVKSLALKGAIAAGGSEVKLDEAALDLGDATFTLAGAASGLGGNSTLAFSLMGRAIKVDRLAERWPPNVAPNPRRWVVANLSGGAIDEINASVLAHGNGLDPVSLALDKLEGNMRLSGVDVRYLGKMPKVQGAGGAARFDDKSLTIAIDKGAAAGIAIDKGTVAITGLDGSDHRIAIDLAVHGPLRAAMELIDAEPLHYASAVGIDPAKVAGDASANVTLKFPLLDKLRFAQVELAASAEMKDLALASAFMGQDLKNGDLALAVDKSGMTVKGTARLAGTPITLDWSENFGPPASEHIRVAGDLDAAARKAFDIDAPEFLDGAVPAVIEVKKAAQEPALVDVSLDLTGAKLTLPRVEWQKASGKPGKAHAALVVADNRLTEITDFSVEAADLVARGKAAFDPADGSFRSLSLERLAFARNDLAGSLARTSDRGYALDVRGAALDASPLVKEQKGEPRKPAPTFTLALAVEKLWLSDKVDLPFSDAKVAAEYGGERVARASIDVKTASGAPFHAEVVPSDGKRTLGVSADNAGEVLKALDVTEELAGGRLKLTGAFDDSKPDSPLSGAATITDVGAPEAPRILKILALPSLTGIASRLSDKDIKFTSVSASFTKTGDHIAFQDGRAISSGFGITFDGWVDSGADTLDINGTIVPAYTLNSLLGKIPILGGVLVGSKGGGIFAASYRVSGNLTKPDVSANPLSALTPGILRRLTGALGGGEAAGPAAKSND